MRKTHLRAFEGGLNVYLVKIELRRMPPPDARSATTTSRRCSFASSVPSRVRSWEQGITAHIRGVKPARPGSPVLICKAHLTLLVGLLLLTGWFLYDHYAKGIDHTEILIIIGAMAVTKLAAMAYYRLTD